jgi:hypothetical protein
MPIGEPRKHTIIAANMDVIVMIMQDKNKVMFTTTPNYGWNILTTTMLWNSSVMTYGDGGGTGGFDVAEKH